ncbi:hypothetical protein CL622_01040 [archaeon]|nr:hypothetical protein [archaeon]|tara:strand:- start:1965 stop:2720 length:756 start_codon:yes stop_codon:yes gene_type:complete
MMKKLWFKKSYSIILFFLFILIVVPQVDAKLSTKEECNTSPENAAVSCETLDIGILNARYVRSGFLPDDQDLIRVRAWLHFILDAPLAAVDDVSLSHQIETFGHKGPKTCIRSYVHRLLEDEEYDKLSILCETDTTLQPGSSEITGNLEISYFDEEKNREQMVQTDFIKGIGYAYTGENSCTRCPDVNDDGNVTFEDITEFVLLRDAGEKGTFDLNRDGKHNYEDQACILDKIGQHVRQIRSCRFRKQARA